MRYILILLLTTLLFSCKNAEKTTDNTVVTTEKPVTTKPSKVPVVLKESLFLTMERTPCFGKCPTYKIMIFNTGDVIFEGFSNTKYIGKYKQQLTRQQLKEIQYMMNEIDITGMKDVYDSGVTDYPSTILYLVSNNTHKKKILDRVDAPASLKQFEKLIDSLVLNDKLVHLSTNK